MSGPPDPDVGLALLAARVYRAKRSYGSGLQADDRLAAAVDEIEKQLEGVRARCLVVDMSGGPAATPELARAVARLLERARGRGFNVALVSPGPEVVRAIGPSRDLVLVATVDEALARVRGRLTPTPTIRVLQERRAA